MTLRIMSFEDIPFMLEVRNDKSTYMNLHTPTEFTIENSEKWFVDTKPIWYIIEENNEKVGYIRTSNWDFESKSMTIGCDIHPSFRKKGYATKAYNDFILKLKNKGWNEVNLLVLKTNKVAIHLYENIGFVVYKEDTESLYMKLNIGEYQTSKKGLKVIVCYFGDRRSNPRNAKDGLNLLKFIWDRETKINQGYKFDTCFIVNTVTPNHEVSDFNDVNSCLEFLKEINGKETANGNAFVEHRENIGISFGAYDYVFHKHRQDYDYWMFIEDDQVLIKEDVFLTGLKQLMEPTENTGFVAIVGVNKNHGPCAHGGCGITNREVLDHVVSNHFNENLGRGSLHFYYNKTRGKHMSPSDLWEGEVMFTKSIHDLGYHLTDIDLKDIIVSWQDYNKRNEKLVPFEHWMSDIDKDRDSFSVINTEHLYGNWKIGQDIINICHLNCGLNRSIENGEFNNRSKSWGRLNYLDNQFQIIWETDDIYFLNVSIENLNDSKINVKRVSRNGAKSITDMERI